MNLLIKYLRPRFGRICVGLLIKFGGTMMDLLIPYIQAYLINDITPLRQSGQVWLWGGIMLICSFFASFGNITANRMAAKVARDTTEQLRNDLFTKVSHLSNSQIDQFTIPSLISRLSTDTYHLHRMIGMIQRMGIRAPIMIIGGIILTMTLDPVLALILTCSLPLLFVIVFNVSRTAIPLFRHSQKVSDRMVRVVREMATGIRVIKALSKTEYEEEHFRTVNRAVVKAETKASTTMSLSRPAMNLILNAGLVLVIWVGAYRINGGAAEAGDLIAFQTYFNLILGAVMGMNRIITEFTKALASADRIQAVLDAPEDLLVKPELPAVRDAEHVVFDKVCFSYNKTQDNISNISFTLKQGETLGIIGPTGAGKSTLAQLLMRFYDVDSGAIRIHGRDIRSMTDEELRTQFGVVFQNDVLFRGDIFENINLGRDLTEAEVLTAAEHAQAASFIEAAGGLTAPVSAKGTNFSGGQKQRMLIARALAKKPEILILDDSSSALDYKTDAAMRQVIRQYFDGTTTVIIAQRISSIKHADHILVLEDGEALGYGTHEELMKTCGLYQEIAHLQMGEGGED